MGKDVKLRERVEGFLKLNYGEMLKTEAMI